MDIENGVKEITDDLEDYDRRWNELNGFIDDRNDKIDETKSALEKINEALGPIKVFQSEIEDVVSQLFLFGDDTEKGEELLDKLKVRNSCNILRERLLMGMGLGTIRRQSILLLLEGIGKLRKMKARQINRPKQMTITVCVRIDNG